MHLAVISFLALLSIFSFFKDDLPFQKAEVEFEEEIAIPGAERLSRRRAPQFFTKDMLGGPQVELVAVWRHATGLEAEVWEFDDSGQGPRFVRRQRLWFQKLEDLAGGGHYTFARLNEGEKYSLVVSDPRGTFYFPVQADNSSPEPQWLLDMTFPGKAQEEFGYLDFALDVDGDGIDELLIPDLERPRLWRRSDDRWNEIPLPELDAQDYSRFYQVDRQNRNSFQRALRFENIVFTPQFCFLDFNRDGKLDLCRFPNDRRVEWYLADAERRGLPDRADAAFLVHPYQDGGFATSPTIRLDLSYDKGDSRTTFMDLNGDKLPDRLESWGNFDPTAPLTFTKFYLSLAAPDYALSNTSAAQFRSRDPIGFNFLADVNRDGMTDLFLIHFEYTITSPDDMADVALGQQIRFILEGYISQDGKWPERPTFRRRMEMTGQQKEYGIMPLLILDGDFTGDGYPDLAFKDRVDRIEIFPFELANRRFSGKAAAQLDVPNEPDADIADFNGDGKDDIMIYDRQKRRMTLHISGD